METLKLRVPQLVALNLDKSVRLSLETTNGTLINTCLYKVVGLEIPDDNPHEQIVTLRLEKNR